MLNQLLYVLFGCTSYNRFRILKQQFVQCRRLSVWSVYFHSHTLSSRNYFSRGYGGGQNTSGKFRGVGGYFLFKIWNFRGGGEHTWNSLHGGGMDIFCNSMYLTKLLCRNNITHVRTSKIARFLKNSSFNKFLKRSCNESSPPPLPNLYRQAFSWWGLCCSRKYPCLSHRRFF